MSREWNESDSKVHDFKTTTAVFKLCSEGAMGQEPSGQGFWFPHILAKIATCMSVLYIGIS